MTGAYNAGVFAGPYHFLRADITTYTWSGTVYTNSGADETTHMIQYAGTSPLPGDVGTVRGDYMRPGYLLPVMDLEAGNARSTASPAMPLPTGTVRTIASTASGNPWLAAFKCSNPSASSMWMVPLSARKWAIVKSSASE